MARSEGCLPNVEKLLGSGFVVLTRNGSDPSTDGCFEAWAYRGPLSFQEAQALTFGVGADVREALKALDSHLPGSFHPRVGEALLSRQAATATVQLDSRELATVLAALRFHQAENLQGGEGIPDKFIREIATDGGRIQPLGCEEIDSLCQRLNTPGGAPRPMKLYETEAEGLYHEHWLASSPADAAERALSHAKEQGLALDCVDVSSMRLPAEADRGGLVYVVNDTEAYTAASGRAAPTDAPAGAEETHPAVQRIHDLLYLDEDHGRAFYDGAKAWDADTVDMIAEVVAEYIPRPPQIES